MLSKNEMRELLTTELESLDIPEPDEVADHLVDQLEDAGAFESESEDE